MREHERRQRLCRQSGCFCTPEENDRFDGIAYGLCPIQHAPAAVCQTCDNMENALRNAVEAEQEWCADLAESGHFDIGCTAIEAEGVVRRTRDAIAAAIRARGEIDCE